MRFHLLPQKLRHIPVLLILVVLSILPLLVIAVVSLFHQNDAPSIKNSVAYAAEPTEAGTKACVVGSPSDPKWAALNEYDAFFERAGTEFGIDPNILKSMAMIESGGEGHYKANGDVLEGADRYGGCSAKGVMQIKDCFWDGVAAEINADILEPEGNIRTAAKLMADWTRETGSWENAITQKYHPGTGQHGLTQGGYVENVKNYLSELGSSGCEGSSGQNPGSPPRDVNSDQSGCVITKVGNPDASPTLPPSCGSAPGDYHNPLATPEQLANGDINKIIKGVTTEMASYADGFTYEGHVEHAGLDIDTVDGAFPSVYAVADGEVVAVTILDGTSCETAVAGCNVTIRHNDDDFSSWYTHIHADVAIGQQVKKGDQIGVVHQWPDPNDHLHFELRLKENNYNINPRIHFPELEQFPIAPGYNGDVRSYSASRGIHLEAGGGTWAEKFRDHPPCPNLGPGDCWAM